jgi:hypothetical protein
MSESESQVGAETADEQTPDTQEGGEQVVEECAEQAECAECARMQAELDALKVELAAVRDGVMESYAEELTKDLDLPSRALELARKDIRSRISIVDGRARFDGSIEEYKPKAPTSNQTPPKVIVKQKTVQTYKKAPEIDPARVIADFIQSFK